MGFDIPNLHIPDNSGAARLIEAIMSEEQVSPAEAVYRALELLENSQANPPIRKRRGPKPPVSADDPEAILGAYGKWPELVQNVESAIAGRFERYEK